MNTSSPILLTSQFSHETMNPAVEHMMKTLRNEKTQINEFRQIVNTLSILLTEQALKNVPVRGEMVTTPLQETIAYTIDETQYAAMVILRAGVGMLNGVKSILPNIETGWIGLKRDEETLEPVEYGIEDGTRFPDNINDRSVLLLDPMLATGGSANKSIEMLLNKGVLETNIHFLNILSAPEGIDKVSTVYPGVKIYSAALDAHLNDYGYICPGLGDAGDRICGDKSWQEVLKEEGLL